MHEYSVMNQLVSALLEELEERDVNRVKEVRIKVGELTFLGDDQLKFAYETLSQDTILEGSELDIENVESKIKCEGCGYEGGVNYSDRTSVHYQVPVISCPECDAKPDIVQGKETKIVGVTAVEE
ncbi:MAG: hydrogenase maturation nickel metallochaperone HypA [Candidatus Thermoplasmatota archaeon]